MTNTKQTVLGHVSVSEPLQENVELTELLPVNHSRINDTPNDKDPSTTDGLKVLRSFTRENDEDLESQDYTLFRRIELIDENSKKSKKIKKDKSKRSYDNDDEENIKLNVRRKLRKVRAEDFPNDEVYYYRQEQQESENNSSSLPVSAVLPKRRVLTLTEKYAEETKKSLQSDNPDDPPINKEEEEKDLRSNIDVIIQASYQLDKDNSSQMNEEINQSEKSMESTESSDIIPTPENLPLQSTETATETKDNHPQKKYHCYICGARFKGSGGLRNHSKVVHGTGPIFTCNDCGKHFPLKERLKLHVRTHTGFKPYKCPECGRCFARGGQLAQHRRTHSLIKPYQCHLCPGTFTCAANLSLHVKRHNNQKDHTCTICDKGFIRRDALKKHLECLHKDLKSFLCVICNKTFKGHLPQHMRTHNQDKPHACSNCGQKFAQKSQLTVHLRTHSGQRPFRCLVCWQAFAHSTALKLHTRRHTGERPFKCSECNVGFTQLPHWKKHMRCIHKRTKPYSCNDCKIYFRKKIDLDNHYKAFHSDEDRDSSSHDGDPFQKGNSSEGIKYNNMSLEKMRLLLAVLLKRISKPERLDELGFGKRLIDEVLQDSLVSAGKDPVRAGELTEHKTLRKNLVTFLEWTVPKDHWETFKKMNKTPEEILETLTTT